MVKKFRSFSVLALFLLGLMLSSFEGCDPYHEMYIRGYVHNEDGQPLQNIEIYASYCDTSIYTYYDSTPPEQHIYKYGVGKAYTDEFGKYIICNQEECTKPFNLQILAIDTTNIYQTDSICNTTWWKTKPGSHKKRDLYKGKYEAVHNFILKKTEVK